MSEFVWVSVFFFSLRLLVPRPPRNVWQFYSPSEIGNARYIAKLYENGVACGDPICLDAGAWVLSLIYTVRFCPLFSIAASLAAKARREAAVLGVAAETFKLNRAT